MEKSAVTQMCDCSATIGMGQKAEGCSAPFYGG